MTIRTRLVEVRANVLKENDKVARALRDRFEQRGTFVVSLVSIALTAMSRTIFSQYLPHNDANVMKSGVDSLPGKVGTVTMASKGALNESAVKVFGSTWTAYPIDGETQLIEGEKVEVVEVKGSSIYVRRVTNELPGWRQN